MDQCSSSCSHRSCVEVLPLVAHMPSIPFVDLLYACRKAMDAS